MFACDWLDPSLLPLAECRVVIGFNSFDFAIPRRLLDHQRVRLVSRTSFSTPYNFILLPEYNAPRNQ